MKEQILEINKEHFKDIMVDYTHIVKIELIEGSKFKFTKIRFGIEFIEIHTISSIFKKLNNL